MEVSVEERGGRDLLRAREALDQAARLRARCWTREDPLGEWERRNRIRPATGRDWKVELAACARLLSEATDLYRGVMELEERACAHLDAAVAGGSTGDAADRLRDALRLRDRVRGNMEQALDISRRLANLSGRVRPEDICGALGRRRELIVEADEHRREADELERRALGAKPLPAPRRFLETEPEPVEEDDWDSWLRSLRSSEQADWDLPVEEETEAEDEVRLRLQEEFDRRVAKLERRHREDRARERLELSEQLQDARERLNDAREDARRAARERDALAKRLAELTEVAPPTAPEPKPEPSVDPELTVLKKALANQEGELRQLRGLLLSIKERLRPEEPDAD